MCANVLGLDDGDVVLKPIFNDGVAITAVAFMKRSPCMYACVYVCLYVSLKCFVYVCIYVFMYVDFVAYLNYQVRMCRHVCDYV